MLRYILKRLLILDSPRGLHHFVNVRVKVGHEAVNLRHHTVACHMSVLLAPLKEATKARHNIMTAVGARLKRHVNGHVVETAIFLLNGGILRLSQLF